MVCGRLCTRCRSKVVSIKAVTDTNGIARIYGYISHHPTADSCDKRDGNQNNNRPENPDQTATETTSLITPLLFVNNLPLPDNIHVRRKSRTSFYDCLVDYLPKGLLLRNRIIAMGTNLFSQSLLLWNMPHGTQLSTNREQDVRLNARLQLAVPHHLQLLLRLRQRHI